MANSEEFFLKYLKFAPFSLAIWRSQEAALISEIEVKHPILDIGCGFGEFAGIFFDRYVEMGIDINEKDLNSALSRKDYKRLILSDARKLPFNDNAFNTIISVSTLEHIKFVPDVLFESYRVLKKGGIFLFTVPTDIINNDLIIPGYLKKIRMDNIAKLYIEIFHRAFKHKVITSKADWIKMTKRAGFEVLRCEGTISRRQIVLFELGLPFSLPTQLFRKIFNKRLPFSPDFRVRLIYRIFKNLLNDSELSNANIMLVARKV